MAISGEGQDSLPAPQGPHRKRLRDEDDLFGDFTVAKQSKRPKVVVTYSEEEVRAAMRPELLSTPGFKRFVDDVVGLMVDRKQSEGRNLFDNKFFTKTKGRLKGGQEVLVRLIDYLHAEAYIRIDIWSMPLHDWFDLVHNAKLEQEFRDYYWESNQRSHAAQIARMAGTVQAPVIRNNLPLAKEYGRRAVDIISRSVFVQGPGHPIIRSAVAIMVLAENDDTATSQETAGKTAQIWAAWCLAKRADGDEIRLLAGTILGRMPKSPNVKTCFLHLHDELRKWVRDIDLEKLKKWKRSHGRCHFIPDVELRNRPLVAPPDGAATATAAQSPSTPSKRKRLSKPVFNKDQSSMLQVNSPHLASHQTKTPQTQAPPTQSPHTQALHTQAPHTQTPQITTPHMPTPQITTPHMPTPQITTPHMPTPEMQTAQMPTAQMQPLQAPDIPAARPQPITDNICIPRTEYNELLTLRYRDPPAVRELTEEVLKQLRSEIDEKVRPLMTCVDEIAQDQFRTRQEFLTSCNALKEQVDCIAQNHGGSLEHQDEELRGHGELLERQGEELRRDGKDIIDLQNRVDQQAKTIRDLKAQLGLLMSQNKRPSRTSIDHHFTAPTAPASMTQGRHHEKGKSRY
ncbi:hypothetical protein CMUS01_11400 [Colletotrichum musicola]|uniref:Uncharacterized protein n=1 Tax=Colletotrichum musicola TaxID=2175873 RepID=A0A8H6N5Y3_9PEZI|nr:hypothetical protein CMUS01_11400 [Colletotrichum musicola]